MERFSINLALDVGWNLLSLPEWLEYVWVFLLLLLLVAPFRSDSMKDFQELYALSEWVSRARVLLVHRLLGTLLHQDKSLMLVSLLTNICKILTWLSY